MKAVTGIITHTKYSRDTLVQCRSVCAGESALIVRWQALSAVVVLVVVVVVRLVGRRFSPRLRDIVVTAAAHCCRSRA